jgi:hypothetical protein
MVAGRREANLLARADQIATLKWGVAIRYRSTPTQVTCYGPIGYDEIRATALSDHGIRLAVLGDDATPANAGRSRDPVRRTGKQ